MKIFIHLYVYKLQRCNYVLCLPLSSWNKEEVKNVGPQHTSVFWTPETGSGTPAGLVLNDVNFHTLVAHFGVFMPIWTLNALFHDTKKAQELVMDMPVLVPSVWTPYEMLLDPFVFIFPWADSLVNNTNVPVLIICCHHCSQYKHRVLQPHNMQH